MKDFSFSLLDKVKGPFKYENIFRNILDIIARGTKTEDIVLFVKDSQVRGMRPLTGTGEYLDISHLEKLDFKNIDEKDLYTLDFSDQETGALFFKEGVPDTIDRFPDIILSLILVLNNFIMFRETSSKITRLSALYEIARLTDMLVNPSNALFSLVKISRSIVDYDSCGLYLVNDKGMQLRYFHGIRPKLGYDVDSELYNMLICEKRSLLTHQENMKSFIAIPLISSEKVVGGLLIGSLKSYKFSNDDLVALSIVSSQLSSMDNLFNTLISVKTLTTDIVDSIKQGIITVNFEKQINLYNKRALDEFPQLGRAAKNSKLNEVFEKGHEFIRLIDDTLERGIIYENERVKIDEKSYEINSFALKNESQYIVGVGIIFRDITEVVEMEDRLRFRDKIITIGELSASIAHEIKNPLAGIKMVAQLLNAELSPEEDSKQEYVQVILQEVNRLDKLINELNEYAKPQSQVLEPFFLPEVIKSVLFLLHKDLQKNEIEVRMDFEPDLPMFTGDRNQFKQLFLNLFRNAINALKDVDDRKKEILVAAAYSDSFKLTVRDNGIGISDDNLEKIFNIFFTTFKEGSGLGLPIVQKIIKNHNGNIDIDSKEGEFTSFKITLPGSG